MTVPTTEIGYASSSLGTTDAWWSSLDDEHVPELRWPLSVEVYNRMRKGDSQVMSVLRAVTMPIRRTTWRLDPNGSRPEVYELLASDLGLPVVGVQLPAARRTRDRFDWAEHLRLALLQLVFGHLFFEQIYRFDDAGRARLRKLAPRMPATLSHVTVARDGGLVSIQQWGVDRPIPVDRLVAYVHEREGGNWYGQSLLRSAWKAWVLKDPALKTWVQTIDRNGMGVPVVTAEEGADPLKYQPLATGFRSGSNSGASLPNGAKVELLGVSGQLPDAAPLVRYLDEQIARAVLAHVLNLGTQTGSWALGSVLADVLTQSLQGMAEHVANTATQHVVEDWVDLNFGPEEPAPKIVFDEIGSQSAATAQALKMLVDAGILFPDRPLEEAVRQMHGLPAKASPVPAARAEAGPTANGIAEMIQKVHLGVGVVMSADEARALLSRAGADLPGSLPAPVAEIMVPESREAPMLAAFVEAVRGAAPPVVNNYVSPAAVTVEPAEVSVTVEPAAVSVVMPPSTSKASRRIERDANGDIARIVEED